MYGGVGPWASHATIFFGIGIMLSYVEDDVLSTLDELMASKRVVNTSRGAIWFQYPLSEDRIYARHLFTEGKKHYEAMGLATMEEARAEHMELELWDDLKELNLTRIPKFMDEILKAGSRKSILSLLIDRDDISMH